MDKGIIIQLIIVGLLGIVAMILSHYHYKKIKVEMDILVKEAEKKELERGEDG